MYDPFVGCVETVDVVDVGVAGVDCTTMGGAWTTTGGVA
jgi:hypothetical protein